MSTETDLYATLIADGTVSALVGTKVYPSPAPPGTGRPLVAYSLLSSVPFHTLPGVNNAAHETIQINCHADTNSGAKTLAAAVIGALEGNGYRVGTYDLYDDITQVYSTIIDWSFIAL